MNLRWNPEALALKSVKIKIHAKYLTWRLLKGMMMSGLKKKRVSEEQKNVLINYMENNMELITGKFTANFSYHDACAKWEDLKNVLNATGSGPNDREVKDWKKTWLELKANAKEKRASFKQYDNGTGGGPKGKSLSDIDQRIMALIGDVCVGIPNVPEFGTGNWQEVILEESHDLNTHETSEFIIDNPQVNIVYDNISIPKTTNKRKRAVDDSSMDELVDAEKRKAAALEKIAESFEKLTNFIISNITP